MQLGAAACEGAQDSMNACLKSKGVLDERRRAGAAAGSPRAGSGASNSLECSALWNSYNSSYACSPRSQSLFLPSPKRNLLFSPSKSIDWLLSPRADLLGEKHVAGGGRGVFNDIFAAPFPNAATPAQRSAAGLPGFETLQRLRAGVSGGDLSPSKPDPSKPSSAVQDTIKAFLASPNKVGHGSAMGARRQAATEDVWLRSRKRHLADDDEFPQHLSLPAVMLPPFSSNSLHEENNALPGLLDHLSASPGQLIGPSSMVPVPVAGPSGNPADSLAWCNSISVGSGRTTLDSLSLSALPPPACVQGSSSAEPPSGSAAMHCQQAPPHQYSLQTPPHYTRQRSKRHPAGSRMRSHQAGEGPAFKTIKMEQEPEQQQQQQQSSAVPLRFDGESDLLLLLHQQAQLLAEEDVKHEAPAAGKAGAASASAKGDNTGRRCNCKKSQCLKLYCDCFSAQMFCSGCACLSCKNMPHHAELVLERQAQIKTRDPLAFEKKIQGAQAQHKKGCNCKKSNCLKKYCECYQGNVICGPHCKCVECKNTTPLPDAQKSSSRQSSKALSSKQQGSRVSEEDISRVRQVSSGAMGRSASLLDPLLPLHQTLTLDLNPGALIEAQDASPSPNPAAACSKDADLPAAKDGERRSKLLPEQQALDAGDKLFAAPPALGPADLSELSPMPYPPLHTLASSGAPGPDLSSAADFLNPSFWPTGLRTAPSAKCEEDVDGSDQSLLCGETALETLPEAFFHTPRAGCDLTPAAFFNLSREFDLSPQALRDLSGQVSHMHCLLSPLRDCIRQTPQQPSPFPSPLQAAPSPLSALNGTQLDFTGFRPQSPVMQFMAQNSLRFFSPSRGGGQVLFSVSVASPSQAAPEEQEERQAKALCSQDLAASSSQAAPEPSAQAQAGRPGLGPGDRVHCLVTPVRIPMAMQMRPPQPVEGDCGTRPEAALGLPAPRAKLAPLAGAVAVITLEARGEGAAARGAPAPACPAPCSSSLAAAACAPRWQQQQQQLDAVELALMQPPRWTLLDGGSDSKQLDHMLPRVKASIQAANPCTQPGAGTMPPPSATIACPEPPPQQQQQLLPSTSAAPTSAPTPARPSVRSIKAPKPSMQSKQLAPADALDPKPQTTNSPVNFNIWACSGADSACASPYPQGFFNCVFNASSPQTQPRPMDASTSPWQPVSQSPGQRRLGPGMTLVRPSFLRRGSKRPRGEQDASPSASPEEEGPAS